MLISEMFWIIQANAMEKYIQQSTLDNNSRISDEAHPRFVPHLTALHRHSTNMAEKRGTNGLTVNARCLPSMSSYKS